MQKRKSHTKSRNGCRNCKKRHVKCDEQGPPCLQCRLRNEQASCVLLLPASRSPAAAPPPASLTPSPSAFSTTPESNRLLELELMHRWSTRSFSCQASTPECQPYLLDHLPRAAMKNGYLLNALFATAALDLYLSRAHDSVLSESAIYHRAALEYGTRAITDFRAQVSSVTRDNIDLVFYFSSLVGVVNFAMSARTDTTMIDRICDYAEMALRSNRLALENVEWLMASASPLSTVMRNFSINLGFLDALDPQTKAALSLLSSVSRQIRIPAANLTIPAGADFAREGQLEAGAEGTFASSVYVYQLAIGQMWYCFAEDLQARLKGYFHTVFAVSGPPFVRALRGREPMAVFIFMYWGVLVHRASKDPALWAVVSEGQDIVSEASELLLRSELADVPGVRDGIAWTRIQVGLPALPGCPLPEELNESGILYSPSAKGPESFELWKTAMGI